jgi:hypothetical protein
VGTLALLFAAVRNPGLFESLVVGSGATSPELAAGGLKDLIEALVGAFDSVEGGETAVQFVTDAGRGSRGLQAASAGRRFGPRNLSEPTLATFRA